MAGRNIFAVGANARVARIAGVDTDKAQIAAFIVCGVCSALLGVFYAYKLKSAVPTVGDNLGLMAIASVALGGTSMAGGWGNVLRTMIGVILIVAVCLNSDTEGRDIIVK